MRRPSTAALTGSALSSRTAQAGFRSLIKSIQRGSIVIGNTASSNTATITAVSTANADLSLVSSSSDATVDKWDCVFGHLALTNATTITATRTGTTGDNQTYVYEVIEYWPGVIKQVQRGTIALTGVGSNTATITTVNTSKARLNCLGFLCTELSVPNRIMTRIELTNATTITATRAVGTNNVTIGYQVVEFY